MNKIKKTVFALFLLSISAITNSKNIVFDLEGVIFIPSKVKIIKNNLGIIDFAKYFLKTGNGKDYLKDRLFEIIDQYLPYPKSTSIPSALEGGKRIPYLHYQNCAGTRSNLEVLCDVQDAIDRAKTSSNLEQKLLHRLATAMYHPVDYTETIRPMNAGVQILKDCHKNGHKIYLLSNWAYESFDLMLEKFADIFGLCTGMAISGYMQIIKPDKQIFQALLTEYKLDPKETFFIDDREQNTKAAESVGITGIWCDNHKNTRTKLKKLGILPR